MLPESIAQPGRLAPQEYLSQVTYFLQWGQNRKHPEDPFGLVWDETALAQMLID
jgi:hypothetical protein